MKHRKRSVKLGRTSSHRRCLMANMLKSLIVHGKIVTSVAKAKELRRHADRMVTLGKKGTLAARREAKARMMVRFNALTPKQARLARTEDSVTSYNDDRKVLDLLFGVLATRFAERQGGYTRITRLGNRQGDNSPQCVIEYL